MEAYDLPYTKKTNTIKYVFFTRRCDWAINMLQDSLYNVTKMHKCSTENA